MPRRSSRRQRWRPLERQPVTVSGAWAGGHGMPVSTASRRDPAVTGSPVTGPKPGEEFRFQCPGARARPRGHSNKCRRPRSTGLPMPTCTPSGTELARSVARSCLRRGGGLTTVAKLNVAPVNAIEALEAKRRAALPLRHSGWQGAAARGREGSRIIPWSNAGKVVQPHREASRRWTSGSGGWPENRSVPTFRPGLSIADKRARV
jgi:hypothetical protein